jgi:adenosylcobinamide-GDP ribazoletransferase
MKDRLQKHIRLLLMSIGFLTWLPVPGWSFQPEESQGMDAYFSLVGALIGGLTALWLYAAALLFPWPVAVALTLVFNGALTGMFHEDGLADTADSLGGTTVERKWEIMRDSRIGTYGSFALFSVLLLKFTALTSLPLERVLPNLIAYAAASRGSGILLLYQAEPVASSRLSHAVALRSGRRRMSFHFLLLILLFLVLRPSYPILALLLTGLIPWLARIYFQRSLRGVSGDCAGAVIVITETALHLSATL